MEGNFAQRMMQKMGWKEGLGLGKTHQGITTPLEHQKTDKRSGVIKAAEQLARAAEEGGEGPPEKKARGVSFQGTPSRVVLLRNIVGPGEPLMLYLVWHEIHSLFIQPCEKGLIRIKLSNNRPSVTTRGKDGPALGNLNNCRCPTSKWGGT